MIRLRGVEAGYGTDPFYRPALRSVDIDVRQGEVVAVLGLNGAGKTTLFRVVAGLLAPRKGVVEVGGTAPASFRRRRGIAFLPASLTPPPGWTLRDLLEEGVGRSPPAEPPPDASAAAARVGLEDALHRPLSRLSTGQLRRGLLAYTLLGAPPVVLLDEPWAGLDLPGRRLLAHRLRACRDGGAAVMVASHELREALPLCDRVVVLGVDGVARSPAVDPAAPGAYGALATAMAAGGAGDTPSEARG